MGAGVLQGHARIGCGPNAAELMGFFENNHIMTGTLEDSCHRYRGNTRPDNGNSPFGLSIRCQIFSHGRRPMLKWKIILTLK